MQSLVHGHTYTYRHVQPSISVHTHSLLLYQNIAFYLGYQVVKYSWLIFFIFRSNDTHCTSVKIATVDLQIWNFEVLCNLCLAPPCSHVLTYMTLKCFLLINFPYSFLRNKYLWFVSSNYSSLITVVTWSSLQKFASLLFFIKALLIKIITFSECGFYNG